MSSLSTLSKIKRETQQIIRDPEKELNQRDEEGGF